MEQSQTNDNMEADYDGLSSSDGEDIINDDSKKPNSEISRNSHNTKPPNSSTSSRQSHTDKSKNTINNPDPNPHKTNTQNRSSTTCKYRKNKQTSIQSPIPQSQSPSPQKKNNTTKLSNVWYIISIKLSLHIKKNM